LRKLSIHTDGSGNKECPWFPSSTTKMFWIFTE